MFWRSGLISALTLIAALAQIGFGSGTAEVLASELNPRNEPGLVETTGGAAPAGEDLDAEEDFAVGNAGPGGANGSVQFRTGNAFGGDSNFSWNNTTKRLGIGGASGSLELAVATSAGLFSNVATRGDAVIRIPGGRGQDLILAVRNGNNGALRFTTGTTSTESERMTITSSGNVGIGTSAPSDQLEITGNLRLPPSTESVGVIKVGEDRFIHNFGTMNTFIGLGSGNFSMSAEAKENTGAGVNALSSNTEGICNTAMGAQTLQANTEGSNNTALGHYALFSNTIGADNTASGVLALYYNTTGSRNTASGDNALVNNADGNDNTANGTFALADNTHGYWNTATGVEALRKNIEGAGNTASGFHALYSNNGNDNAAIGWYALYQSIFGHDNVAIGTASLGGNTTGSDNTGIGAHADVSTGSLTNATAIGSGAVVDASNKIRLGNDDVSVIEGRVPYTWCSDLNLKENFRPVDGEGVLRKIRGLNLRSWNYIGDAPQQFRHYGPVAQEFFAAFGHDEVGTSGTPTTINSGDEAGILMMAVQALEKRTEEVETLKAEIAELRALIHERWGDATESRGAPRE